jgi:hypothetical protein
MEYLIILGVVATMALYTLIIARCSRAGMAITFIATSRDWLVNQRLARQTALSVRLREERRARDSLCD